MKKFLLSVVFALTLSTPVFAAEVCKTPSSVVMDLAKRGIVLSVQNDDTTRLAEVIAVLKIVFADQPGAVAALEENKDTPFIQMFLLPDGNFAFLLWDTKMCNIGTSASGSKATFGVSPQAFSKALKQYKNEQM